MRDTIPRIFPASSDDLKKYIGRTYEQANCWDLIREVYLNEMKLELKRYYAGLTPESKQTESLVHSNRGDFVKVEPPLQFGDLVLIKIRGVECHIGLYAFGSKFLHSMKGTGSVLDSLEKHKHVVSGYYRHRSFAA